MVSRILIDIAVSITDTESKSDESFTACTRRPPLSVLNRNLPAFYYVPADVYEMIMDGRPEITQDFL